MDETKIISEVFQHYGMGGLLILWIVWDKILHPMHKKSKGTWRSWDALDRNIKEVEVKLNDHLKLTDEKLVAFTKLQVGHDNLMKTVETENIHIFNQLKDIHAKIDSMLKFLLEQKK